MVSGTCKAYRCQKCAALILVSQNGKALVVEDNSERHPMPGRDKPSLVLNMLKNAVRFLTCPQCGSLDVIEDPGIKT